MSSYPDSQPSIKVRRNPDRAHYDSQTINSILDQAWIAHVGTVHNGAPIVIPMYYVRDGNWLLLHGAPAAGVLARGGKGPISVAVTHLDGLVLARSAFHHSMNYRSVVVLGEPELVEETSAKERALELFVERMVPGRQAELRPTTPKEIRGTHVLRISLDRASAKVRVGPPVDDDEDYDLEIWAGVVPMGVSTGAPVGDNRSPAGVSVPDSVLGLAQSASS